MVPRKLVELKRQIEHFLEKKFISLVYVHRELIYVACK